VLGSLLDFHDTASADSVTITFGPTAPTEHADRWIQTLPDAGWLVYFRIYGPEEPAFDSSWQLPDFERRR
jgi:hypothetical protein